MNDRIVVQELCYLDNVVGSSGDVQSIVTARIVLAGENLVTCFKYYVGEFSH